MRFKQNENLSTQQHRAAFTLLEMLLVLSLLLVLVSVVWPAVLKISATNRLRQSMQDVNSAFAAARIRAIEHGVTYQIYFELGGRRYLVVPVDKKLLGLETEPATSQQNDISQAVISQELSEGFEFSEKVTTVVSDPSIPFEWLSNFPKAKEWEWMEASFPITFYPDGTAALDLNHEIIGKEKEKVASIQLRGLTGSTTISYDQEKSK